MGMTSSNTHPQTVWASFAGKEFRFRVVQLEGNAYLLKLPGSDGGTISRQADQCYPSSQQPHTQEEIDQELDPCKGSGRVGLTPQGGKRAPEDWKHWHMGELRCPFCGQYLKHGPTGRLPDHTKP